MSLYGGSQAARGGRDTDPPFAATLQDARNGRQSRRSVEAASTLPKSIGENGRYASDFAVSRIWSMNARTAGLSVRFFRVVIATGNSSAGNLIGSAFSDHRAA
jgi:hypothetical protein